MVMPVKIFICYARKDEALLNKLKTYLIPLQRRGLIDVWYDRDISTGTEWEPEIYKRLNIAQVILLLISPYFMASDYCYDIEMKKAVERHERGEVRIIPIILSPAHWREAPFGKLQVLPKNAKPLISWRNRDDAFYEVSEGIRKVAEELSMRRVQDVRDDKASLPELEFSFLSYSDPFSGPVDKDVLPDEGKEDVSSFFPNRNKILFANEDDISTSLTSSAGKVPSEFMTNRDLVQNTTLLTLEQVKSAWERVKKRVKGRNNTGPKTAAYLKDYSIVGVESEADITVVIIQAAHTLHYKYMHENNYSAGVEWALGVEFDQKCRVRLLPPGQPIQERS